MGLRINTNITALTALRTLRLNDRAQARSLERLSTGLRINRGADDPSGLVISEQLRAQLAALNQAVSNSQNASNMVTTADAALAEVSNLLVQIQDSIVFALNTGGASPEQIAAEQDAVDQAIAAIDRIANTTRFAGRNLLNGASEFKLSGNVADMFDDLLVKSVTFPGDDFERTLTVSASVNPQRATLRVNGASAATGAVIRVTGARGTQDVVIASGASATSMADAINSVAGFTGVYASGVSSAVLLRSEDFGSAETILVEGVSGALGGSSFERLNDTGATGAAEAIAVPGGSLGSGEIISDQGRDGQVEFDGQTFTGVGSRFSIMTPSVQFSFRLDPGLVTSDTGVINPALPAGGTFTVANTGLNFQLNELPLPTDQFALSIQGIQATRLGLTEHRDRIAEAIDTESTAQITRGGFLNTVRTGGGNDLTEDPNNAAVVVQAAIDDIAGLRGYLGAVQADTLEPNIDALNVAIENLSASLSDLRDLDFAEETANFTRSQILFQSGIAVLASANLIPQSVLTLLS